MINYEEGIEIKVKEEIYTIRMKDDGTYTIMHRGWYYGSEIKEFHEAVTKVAEHYAANNSLL